MSLKLYHPLDADAKFEEWVARVKRIHTDFLWVPNPEVAFVTSPPPLSQATVALVSTGGVHLADQTPFDIESPHGDSSYRLIPGDVDTASLRFTHSHYDTTDTMLDPNCMFPIERLRELAADGEIGAVSPVHAGCMGFIPNPDRLRDETAPAIAEQLRSAGVNVAVLSPG